MNYFSVLFQYSFMTRALIGGLAVALCGALLGVPLVLKRTSMIGDGLSHVGFGAMAVAIATNAAPLALALPITGIAAFFLLRLSQNSKVGGDAAIALVSSSALAIGVIVSSVSAGSNIDIMNYLFGSILTLSKSDMMWAVILSVLVLIIFSLLYHRIFALTFDETFAKATGLKVSRVNLILALLTAITIVVGMRLMGTLLISSLLVFPALSSMRIGSSFQKVIIGSGVISLIAFFVGLYLSYSFATPTGASIVVTNLVLFCVLSLVSFCRSRRHAR